MSQKDDFKENTKNRKYLFLVFSSICASHLRRLSAVTVQLSAGRRRIDRQTFKWVAPFCGTGRIKGGGRGCFMETLECFTGDKRGRTTLLLRRAPALSRGWKHPSATLTLLLFLPRNLNERNGSSKRVADRKLGNSPGERDHCQPR